MRLTTATLALLTTCATLASAQAYWRNVPPPLDHYRDEYRSFKQKQTQQQAASPLHPVHSAAAAQPQTLQNQAPLAMPAPPNPGPAIPASPDQDNEDPPTDSALTISDILPRPRQINIFASLTRDISSVTSRLESSSPDANSTLLAPLNSAMHNLPRKPWEDRPDDNSGVSAARDEDKAARNLERFVLEHIVPVSPWKEGEKVKTLGGGEIWWETRKGGDKGDEERKVVMPGEVVVEGVLGRVGNGEVWALRGVVNYE